LASAGRVGALAAPVTSDRGVTPSDGGVTLSDGGVRLSTVEAVDG
jgi:hypothetical protein